MILAPPAGDAFNFGSFSLRGLASLTGPVVDLNNYPTSFFYFIMAIGLYIVRQRRRKLNLPRSEFRAWDIAVIFLLASNLFMLVGPWYPPKKGRDGGDVSFWYAAYVVTGIGMYV